MPDCLAWKAASVQSMSNGPTMTHGGEAVGMSLGALRLMRSGPILTLMLRGSLSCSKL